MGEEWSHGWIAELISSPKINHPSETKISNQPWRQLRIKCGILAASIQAPPGDRLSRLRPEAADVAEVDATWDLNVAS